MGKTIKEKYQFCKVCGRPLLKKLQTRGLCDDCWSISSLNKKTSVNKIMENVIEKVAPKTTTKYTRTRPKVISGDYVELPYKLVCKLFDDLGYMLSEEEYKTMEDCIMHKVYKTDIEKLQQDLEFFKAAARKKIGELNTVEFIKLCTLSGFSVFARDKNKGE